VIDGDTIRVRGQSIRVLGLDAPETEARCPREAVLARQATSRMRELISGGVEIEPHGRDRYGRLLAVVTDGQGRDVARVLISEGLARPYWGGHRGGWCG
jgi:endonuclease YncB( thermonuclease family)